VATTRQPAGSAHRCLDACLCVICVRMCLHICVLCVCVCIWLQTGSQLDKRTGVLMCACVYVLTYVRSRARARACLVSGVWWVWVYHHVWAHVCGLIRRTLCG